MAGPAGAPGPWGPPPAGQPRSWGPPPAGQWQTAWAAPPGPTGPAPAPPPPAVPAPGPHRRHLGIVAAGLALALGSASVGAGVGAVLANRKAASSPAASSALPVQSGGSGIGSSGAGSSGAGSSGATGSASSAAGATGSPSADEAAIAAKVDPGVVDINTTLGYQNAAAAGTGMVITSSGEVLTNNHVVDGATKITVRINGTGPSYTATVLGTDPTDDVALLQIHGVSGLKTVPLGDSSKVSAGAAVVAIGNALGLQGPPSVSSGTITALDQSVTASDTGGSNAENLTGLLQTDAPLQPGDSGGPLVDTSGQVIGMDTAASVGTRFSSMSNVAFAIPINHALAIAKQIEAGQASAAVHIGPSPMLGVQIQSSGGTQGGFGSFGRPAASAGSGAVVAGVATGTPAASAGVVAGDTIVSFDGKTVSSASDLSQAIASHHPGDTVQLGWADQSGQRHTATVKLATGPAN
ncbi:MAG TPA: trypsin-like peptidase domain-containing protein [Acidimicrobiales bacterium]|nr:trypsin-like peptidase domain-containing protein [Acidimicrobiales bacterium]